MIDIIGGVLDWMVNHLAGLALILVGAGLVSWYKFTVAGLMGMALILLGAGAIIFSFL